MSDASGSPSAAERPRDPLGVQATRLANRIHDQLQGWGRPELAQRVTAEAAQWGDQRLVVVTCGDIKRGKSSLLNALLDRAELLPVDADVATSVHLVVTHGTAETATVTRIGDDGEPRTEEVALDDLVDVASMRGDPARRAGVVSVAVEVDHPLLERGVALIDTPGVGGMSRGHRDLALAALARADLLLFTISAQEPVARTELDFLAEATEHTRRLVVVVTKADVNTDVDNGRMLAEHREKVLAHAASLRERPATDTLEPKAAAARLERVAATPMVLTSSHLAHQARRRREAGRLEQAAEMHARSGVSELSGLIARSVEQRGDIRTANLLQLLGVLLDDVERELRARQRASSGDSTVADDLAALQRSMEGFSSTSARWRTTLGNNIVRLQTSASRLVTHELNRVKEHYREVIEGAADVEALTDALPADLERSLHGAWNHLVDAINREFATTLGGVLEDFGTAGMETVLGPIDMPDALRSVTGARIAGPGEASLLDDGLPLAMQTFTFGNIANAAARVLGLSTGGLGLVAYGIGAAIAYPIGKMRKQQRERQRVKVEYQRYVAELLFGNEGVAKEFTTELSLRILDLREEVERFVEQRLVERKKQLDAELRELQSVMKAEAGKRQEVQRAATAQLEGVQRLRSEIEPLQRAVEGRLAAAPAS